VKGDKVSKMKASADIRFLITRGPTREFFDPIRYISNRSSGEDGLRDCRGGASCLVTGGTGQWADGAYAAEGCRICLGDNGRGDGKSGLETVWLRGHLHHGGGGLYFRPTKTANKKNQERFI